MVVYLRNSRKGNGKEIAVSAQLISIIFKKKVKKPN